MNKRDKERSPERWREMLDEETERLRHAHEQSATNGRNLLTANTDLMLANARIKELEEQLEGTKAMKDGRARQYYSAQGAQEAYKEAFETTLEKLMLMPPTRTVDLNHGRD